MNVTSLFEDSLSIFYDSRMFLHFLLVWVVSLVFCWKVFPLIFSKKEEVPKEEEQKSPVKTPSSLMPPPASPRPRSPVSPRPRSPELPSQLNPTIRRSGGRFIKQLELEVCQKAKEAGKHPSYSDLVLSLVHNYNLDINKPVLPRGFSIFHSACLSCSPELVSSLSPMAELDRTTAQGDSPLYLAVYAASHRLEKQQLAEEDGLEVVRLLLEAGSDVNLTNSAGWSALQQAHRMGHGKMIRSEIIDRNLDCNIVLCTRLLLDRGAETRPGLNSTISEASGYTRLSSRVTTRSMSRLNSTLVSK